MHIVIYYRKSFTNSYSSLSLYVCLFLCAFIHSEASVHSMQFLDVINMKDPAQKAHFYRVTLCENLPLIPKVKIYKQIVSFFFGFDCLRISIIIMYYSKIFQ